jgi:uncharacterized membrane protein YphA (DoxX/SURF4 family)
MNVILWIVQGLLALAFIAAGAAKLFAYEKYKARSEARGSIALSRGLGTLFGIAELAGGVGIVWPMVTKWAAAELAAIMLVLIGIHLSRHESPRRPGFLFLLSLLVAIGRFFYWK